MTCPECNGTGVVVSWNLRDDSGDGVDICSWCDGYGYIALTEDGKNDHSVPKMR